MSYSPDDKHLRQATDKQKIFVLLKKLYDAEEHIKESELKTRYQELKTSLFSHFYNTMSINGEVTNYQFNNSLSVSEVSAAVKLFIAEIEEKNLPGSAKLLQYYKEQGIYKMLYHNPVVVGQHYKFSMNFIIYILGIVAAAVAFFAIVSFLGLTGGWVIAATALFAGAVAYLSGILYGICNDMFATRSNLPYFLLGHQPGQCTFFLSNDPNVQAIGWGVLATNILSIIFAVIFVIVVASVMAATSSPFAAFILPCMLVATPLLAVFADLLARSFAKSLVKSDANYIVGANPYQENALQKMCPTKEAQARWHGNGARNLFGYIAAPILGVTGLVLTLTLPNLPVVFFSPLVSTILPLALAGMAVVVLAVMLTYFFVNRDKQVDDRFKVKDTKLSYSIGRQILPDQLHLDAEDNIAADKADQDFFKDQLVLG